VTEAGEILGIRSKGSKTSGKAGIRGETLARAYTKLQMKIVEQEDAEEQRA
jgi:hypothetical protein